MIHNNNSAKCEQQSVNHSTSHSSLVSSVGEDSGLGQTSPILAEKSAVVAQVDNGGIVMQSDALSADQLADLQRRIEVGMKEK
jgi:acid phosphatase family membrane protein YuiD